MSADNAHEGTTLLATGTRLRCPQCRSEAIVTHAGDASLRCCAGRMDVIFAGSGR